jgi:hypothetical protein
MIEVIRRGVPYPERTVQLECLECLSLLRFKGADVIEGTSVKYIVCPVCDQWVDAKRAKPYDPASSQAPQASPIIPQA